MDKVSYSKMFAVVFSAIIAAFAVILLLYVFSLEAQQEIYEEQLDLINKTVTIDAIQMPTIDSQKVESLKNTSNTEHPSVHKFKPDSMCSKYLDIYAKSPSKENKVIVKSVCDIYLD